MTLHKNRQRGKCFLKLALLPFLEPMLKAWGVEIPEKIVMCDPECVLYRKGIRYWEGDDKTEPFEECALNIIAESTENQVQRTFGLQKEMGETKNAAIFHKAFGSSGGRYNPLAYYYLNRNQILLANWLLPIPWKMIHPLVNIPLCLTRALKNIMYSRPKSARAVLRGVVDGYTGVIGKWKHHDREVMRSDAV